MASPATNPNHSISGAQSSMTTSPSAAGGAQSRARKPSKAATLAKLGVHHKLKVPMYVSPMHVVWVESAYDGVKFLETMFPNDELELESCADSRTVAFVMPIDDWPWMVLPYDADVDTIAHEAVHAGHLYLSAAGVEVTGTNDEPLAYFVGWLTGRLVSLQADAVLERAKRQHPTPPNPNQPAVTTKRQPKSIKAAGALAAAAAMVTANPPLADDSNAPAVSDACTNEAT